MAIDYQQILMQMNRPHRRSGSLFRKTKIGFLVVILFGGGAYAAWRFNLVGAMGSALNRTADFASAFWAEKNQAQPGEILTSGIAGISREALADELRLSTDDSLESMPAPAPDGPISVAIAGSNAPSRPYSQPRTSAANPVRVPDIPAPPVAVSAPAGVSFLPAGVSAAGPETVPSPVLSAAMEQIRAVDQMLSSNPAEAMRLIEELVSGTRLTEAEAAEAGYRLGYAARMLRDEDKAEKSWREAADQWPALRGGRFSALALADTLYHRYAGERSQISYWDDIQIMYSRVLGQDDAPFFPEAVKERVKGNLKRLNDALFFGPAPSKLARYHKVESGELLGGIANKYRVDHDSIARINGINPHRINVGMDLKLIVGEVNIVVRKNVNDPDLGPTVTWFLDGRWVREYPACVGDGMKTPAGVYVISSKEKFPSWTNPANGQLLPNDHPENILGSRWMAMKGMDTRGMGIHGTTVDDSIPGYTSAGCVRLHDKDVEELFSFARINNKVTILD
ncbi:MAG: L,D-transpeptidase family protein [Planctomycetes bacterium]|nr:L,D-transpeptidase family protein [Planctomycetota bacterium]